MQDFNTENYEIKLWGQDRGSFEHRIVGEESAGGLWFDGDNLTDYDGVYSLPKEIQHWLLCNGYTHLDSKGREQLELTLTINKDVLKLYHVSVDVTRSIDVYVDANNEREAKRLAIIEADLRSTIGAGAWVSSNVHFISEEE